MTDNQESTVTSTTEQRRLTKDDFTSTYTINMKALGEDGEHYVAFSHIEPEAFIHDLRRYSGVECLGEDDDELMQRLIDQDFADVRHEWAVIDSRTSDGEWGSIRWDDVTEETPGAFPITRLSFEL